MGSSTQKFLKSISAPLSTKEERAQQTIKLASLLLKATQSATTHAEKKQAAQMAKMMQDTKGRTLITQLTDQCFRSTSNTRIANQLHFLIKKYGIPTFFNENERMKFLLFYLLGTTFPHFFVPKLQKQIRKAFSDVLLPETAQEQKAFLNKCQKNTTRINLNHLGEAILGEEEANRRLEIYLKDLSLDEIDYISVKISTIFSQINPIAFSQNLEILAERLRTLYRAARGKFVNLDMEEAKDLDLTVALFQKVLSEEEFLKTHAGIALQAYLPQSFKIQQSLTQWAKKRVEKGGVALKIRLVKGANLSMEIVESSLMGWLPNCFEQKVESDANFKRMLAYGLQLENAQAMHIGVGSHNLFDIAYALILRAENHTEPFVHFEMLKGMATPMQRVIHALTGNIVLYCPEAKAKDFHTAIAYLIRRLEENSGSENFLRHLYELQPANQAWEKEKERFLHAIDRVDTLLSQPKRMPIQPMHTDDEPFKNEPDTDFSIQQNRESAEALLKRWESKKIPPIPLVINGEEISTIQENGIDPSSHKPLYKYSLADVPLIEKAIECGKTAQKEWENLEFKERSSLLGQAAQQLRIHRKELIGAMVADGGKTILEADPEISEAIDFIEYYRKNWEKQLKMHDLQWRAKGIVLITPPWNFPCSIPTGGIAAALTAGNSVLFKPAPEAVLVGWHLVQCFWQAGVPKNVLQFINCKEEPVGNYLIKHPGVSTVLLTGATQTAHQFLKLRPGLDLHAETGGKNALIITNLSDRDLAIRDLVTSAFGHSGQKCSACSLAILDAEVYDDPDFKRQLLDATKSLPVASAWNPAAKITPLIHPPGADLLKGLTQLEEDESWLLKPTPDSENPHLWSPGIKWGVTTKSFSYKTELFGPLLSVMRATSLEEAIALANGTPYGLTSGIHTLDEREQTLWKEKIIAGNLYINRGITGAIVRRQPFGGCKASGYGAGAKAGGPNYVNQLALPSQVALPHERASLPPSLIPLLSSLNSFGLNNAQREIWKTSAENYAYWAEILKEPTDPSSLLGQDNYFYHVPHEKIHVQIHSEQHLLPLLQVVAACLICKTPLEISSSIPLKALTIVPVIQEEPLAIFNRNPTRIRLFEPPHEPWKQQAAKQGVFYQELPVLANGRIELLNYLREVALSVNFHRYGLI
ncbi:MAG: 1-pyrroline-5-carboxylate dehydrogenase [Chlamydiales bacterium]|nr:1-pyrroline-5-carboxylate dehydrogenase [Chlamydiales bacterium]